MPDNLPAVNACLNALCGVLLIAGYVAIKAKRIALHRNLMTAAFTVSIVFLSSYLYYHIVVKGGEPTRFTKDGVLRSLYFGILGSHTILAVVVAVAAPITLVQGYRNRIEKHRRLARWLLPIWVYVSVTGVLVYWMLYRL